MSQKEFQPGRVRSYFLAEWKVLLAVTVSGLIYNVGLLANPWFEGKLAGCLVDVLSGRASFQNMLTLVCWFVGIISIVQIARYIKRFYVRRFANNINRRMKKILYHSLLQKKKTELEQEGVGNVMIKAISDVDDCAEGMRKFTTEVFDTGVALICYTAMLFTYDWRLSLLAMLFPPISYFLAEKMKFQVQKTGVKYKEQAGKLSADTLDRVSGALTYRVFGCDRERGEAYEKRLTDYEKAARKANIWIAALPPLYHVISMLSVLFILYFGARNVLGQGWCRWDIAAFTTYLACFTKLSVKSSKAAKLFNSVHKAQVSWKRIRPFLNPVQETEKVPVMKPAELVVEQAGFTYPSGERIFAGLSFQAKPGQIIGVTGPVASGKSTLGKMFLCETPYEGSVKYDGKELSAFSENERRGIVGYLGHDTELLGDSIRNNILLGDEEEVSPYLKMVCLDQETAQMKEREHTLVGNGGVRLSGGQAQRLALARTLHGKKPLLVLDDPFSALDRKTEGEIYENLRSYAKERIVILISHRLYLFPKLDGVIWINQGQSCVGTHEELMQKLPQYAEICVIQGLDFSENHTCSDSSMPQEDVQVV